MLVSVVAVALSFNNFTPIETSDADLQPRDINIKELDENTLFWTSKTQRGQSANVVASAVHGKSKPPLVLLGYFDGTTNTPTNKNGYPDAELANGAVLISLLNVKELAKGGKGSSHDLWTNLGAAYWQNVSSREVNENVTSFTIKGRDDLVGKDATIEIRGYSTKNYGELHVDEISTAARPKSLELVLYLDNFYQEMVSSAQIRMLVAMQKPSLGRNELVAANSTVINGKGDVYVSLADTAYVDNQEKKVQISDLQSGKDSNTEEAYKYIKSAFFSMDFDVKYLDITIPGHQGKGGSIVYHIKVGQSVHSASVRCTPAIVLLLLTALTAFFAH